MKVVLITFCFVTLFAILSTQTPIDSGVIASTCMNAIMDSLPPEFCWKKKADAGKIPYDCPNDFFRYGLLCYQHCSGEYAFFVGVCYQKCSSGYTDIGAICGKNLFRWYFKKSYIPRIYNNFNSEVPCPPGMYKAGALCYRDCNKFMGMSNCGIGACSTDSQTCSANIKNIVLDVFTGIADGIACVFTFGLSTLYAPGKSTALAAVKAKMLPELQRMGTDHFKHTLERIKTLFKTQAYKEQIISKSVEKVKKIMTDEIKKSMTEDALVGVCKVFWDTAVEKINDIKEESADGIVLALDFFNIEGIKTDCEDAKTEQGGMKCAARIMGNIKTWDPTGLFTIAATFLKPSCDV